MNMIARNTKLESVAESPVPAAGATQERPLRVALLVNENAPYRLPLYRSLASTPHWDFKVFTSIDREYNRMWEVPKEVGFPTKKSYSLEYSRRHRVAGPGNYSTRRQVHLPIGVIADMLRFRPDVVISQELGARTLLATLTAKLLRHRLIIISESTPHTEMAPTRAQQIVRRVLSKQGDAYLCNGVQARQFLENLGVVSGKIYESGQAIDLESFDARALGCSGQAFREQHQIEGTCYLYVGHLIFTKGLGQLINAWKEFSQQAGVEATLLLAGDGEDRATLEQQVAQAGLTNVKFLGFIQRNQLAEVYAAADLFVFPTLSDCFSLAFEEALAASLPVIGSIYGGESELVEEGANGWIVDPLSHQDLLDKLQLAWQRRDDLPAMGQRSRELVERMGIEQVAQRFRKTVQQTVAKT
jgi:glycosyltransferase involved in cell wall biosynthesis